MKKKHKASIQNGVDENVAMNGDNAEVPVNGDSKKQNGNVEIIL